MIKWGILGTGKIASKFSSEFAYIEDACVYAIGSRELSKARTFAKKHAVLKYYGDYESLLKDPEIDAVYIATPHASHCQYTLAALEHEKAVLCEKPMGMTFDEVRVMTVMAAKKRQLLMEALWTAFLPQFLYLQQHLKNNTFGNLRSVEADFGFQVDANFNSRLLNKALGGGSLLDIGIYPVFLALSTLGVPDDIQASADFFETGVDKHCNIHFNYVNGASAHLLSSFVRHTPTEATLKFDNTTLKIHGRFHEPSQIALFEKGRKTIKKFPSKGLGYHYEITHFNELLKEGKTESPIMSFKTSLALAKLLDEIRLKIGLHY